MSFHAWHGITGPVKVMHEGCGSKTATAGSDRFVCLDAGTVYSGIRKAIAEGLFEKSVHSVLKNFPVGIIHIKPIGNNKSMIKKPLLLSNSLHLKIIFPEKGKLLYF
jgi:hypothetical protein